jgi:hypothetical protein
LPGTDTRTLQAPCVQQRDNAAHRRKSNPGLSAPRRFTFRQCQLNLSFFESPKRPLDVHGISSRFLAAIAGCYATGIIASPLLASKAALSSRRKS